MNASREWLKATHIALARGGRLLFEDLSFAVGPGEALVLTGPNGAGKSSLLRLIAGLLDPAAGEIERPARIGLLASEQALKPDRKLGDELAFWARLDGASPEAIAEAAELAGIAPLLDLGCRMLSSGQRQRAAIARLIAGGFSLWLLDEPTNALDQRSTDRLLTAIERHRAAGGLVVAATHQPLDLAGAERLDLSGTP